MRNDYTSISPIEYQTALILTNTCKHIPWQQIPLSKSWMKSMNDKGCKKACSWVGAIKNNEWKCKGKSVL